MACWVTRCGAVLRIMQSTAEVLKNGICELGQPSARYSVTETDCEIEEPDDPLETLSVMSEEAVEMVRLFIPYVNGPSVSNILTGYV